MLKKILSLWIKQLLWVKLALILVVAVIIIAIVSILVTSRGQELAGNDKGAEIVLPEPLPMFEDFGVRIKSINVSSPIIPDVNGFDERIYYPALLKGIGQFKGSLTPDKEGNLFIFGHSSYVGKGEGKYKEILKDLNKLSPGDEVEVFYKKASYLYKVEKSYLTDVKDWSLLDPTQDNIKDKTLTIMTCWPPGSDQKRWAIKATQI